MTTGPKTVAVYTAPVTVDMRAIASQVLPDLTPDTLGAAITAAEQGRQGASSTLVKRLAGKGKVSEPVVQAAEQGIMLNAAYGKGFAEVGEHYTDGAATVAYAIVISGRRDQKTLATNVGRSESLVSQWMKRGAILAELDNPETWGEHAITRTDLRRFTSGDGARIASAVLAGDPDADKLADDVRKTMRDVFGKRRGDRVTVADKRAAFHALASVPSKRLALPDGGQKSTTTTVAGDDDAPAEPIKVLTVGETITRELSNLRLACGVLAHHAADLTDAQRKHRDASLALIVPPVARPATTRAASPRKSSAKAPS